MSRFEQGKTNNLIAARDLISLLRGEEGHRAQAGAMLVASAFDDIRALRRAWVKQRGV